MKYLYPLLTLFLFVACSDEAQEETPTSPRTIEFTVLQLNDVYEIAPLEGGKVAGLARVAALKKELEQENPNLITILSGDFLSPSLIGTLKIDGERLAGKQMIDVLNHLGLDYVTFGNHEFDLKEYQLQERLNESEFSWTVCNAFQRKNDSTLTVFHQSGNPIPDHVVHNFVQGQDTLKVGLIGTVLPFNKQNYVAYTDVNSTVAATWEQIKPNCDLGLLITHLNMDEDMELAKEVTDIPLFMGGHDHTAQTEVVGNVTITKADANAKTVYIHRCVYDLDAGTYTIDSELRAIDDSMEEDAQVAAVVDQWNSMADSLMTDMGYVPDEVIYTTEEPLDGRESSIRYHTTNLGDYLVASIMLSDNAVDVALLNSGSVRLDDQLIGQITQYDVLRTLPFGGGITYTNMDGKTLIEVLNIGTVTNVGVGGYLQIAGAEALVPNTGATVWRVNGEDIDPNKTYKVAGPEFLMAGKETNLEVLGTLTGTTPELVTLNMRNDIRDIFIYYLRNDN